MDWLWPAIIAACFVIGLAIDAVAAYDDDPRTDTLSQAIWYAMRRWWIVRMMVLAGLVWLAAHLVGNGYV